MATIHKQEVEFRPSTVSVSFDGLPRLEMASGDFTSWISISELDEPGYRGPVALFFEPENSAALRAGVDAFNDAVEAYRQQSNQYAESVE